MLFYDFQCSVDCGRGQRTREVVCVSAIERIIPENSCKTVKPLSSEICDMGSCAKAWFYTEWSQQVSKITLLQNACKPWEGTQLRDLHVNKAYTCFSNSKLQLACSPGWWFAT